MKRYGIPIEERWTVQRHWMVYVEAETQADAVALVERQLEADIAPESLTDIERVSTACDDWEHDAPCEIVDYDITEGPCLPDPRQTTLF